MHRLARLKRNRAGNGPDPSKKRAVTSTSSDANDEEDLDLEQAAMSEELSDSFVGVQMLLKRSEGRIPTDIPVTFAHHIYSVVKRRSTVDQELQAASEKGLVRLLYANSGPSDRAVVLETDYRLLVQNLIEEWKACNKPSEDVKVLERFLEHVLPSCRDHSVSSNDLFRFLFDDLKDKDGNSQVSLNWRVRKPEAVLSDANLLIRRVDVFEAKSFWFTMPKLGEIIGLLQDGRKHILATVKRKKNSEMLQRDLVNLVISAMTKKKGKSKAAKDETLASVFHVGRRPKSSSNTISDTSKTPVSGTAALVSAVRQMGIEYHIMDCIQSGTLRAIETGLGPLLKPVRL